MVGTNVAFYHRLLHNFFRSIQDLQDLCDNSYWLPPVGSCHRKIRRRYQRGPKFAFSFPKIILAQHSLSFLSSKRYTVTYDIVTVSNIEDFRRDTLKYDHEETNTFLVFQAINNVTISSFSECCLYSSDTDDFLLVLVYCRPFLRNVTYGILILTFCMRHLKIQWGIKTIFMEICFQYQQ